MARTDGASDARPHQPPPTSETARLSVLGTALAFQQHVGQVTRISRPQLDRLLVAACEREPDLRHEPRRQGYQWHCRFCVFCPPAAGCPPAALPGFADFTSTLPSVIAIDAGSEFFGGRVIACRAQQIACAGSRLKIVPRDSSPHQPHDGVGLAQFGSLAQRALGLRAVDELRPAQLRPGDPTSGVARRVQATPSRHCPCACGGAKRV